MRLTGRVLLLAVVATFGALVVWPEAAELVARLALVALGAAFVADLVIALRATLPAEPRHPFAPQRSTRLPPWQPHGLTELERELRLVGADGDTRALPTSTRLRTTCHAAAAELLRHDGIPPGGLDDPASAAATAARGRLGTAVYDFITGRSPTVDVEELLGVLAPARP